MDGVVSSKLMETCIAIRCYKAGKQRQTESNHKRIKGGIKQKYSKVSITAYIGFSAHASEPRHGISR